MRRRGVPVGFGLVGIVGFSFMSAVPVSAQSRDTTDRDGTRSGTAGVEWMSTRRADTTRTRAAEQRLATRGLDLMRVGKWSTLAASLGVAGYGFVASVGADDAYVRLETVCVSDPARCGRRTPSGAYADTLLEERYQSVLRRERRARRSLIVGQAGLVASVVLFVLDLRRRGPPPNIPFEPSRLIIEPDGNGALRIEYHVRLQPFPF